MKFFFSFHIFIYGMKYYSAGEGVFNRQAIF